MKEFCIWTHYVCGLCENGIVAFDRVEGMEYHGCHCPYLGSEGTHTYIVPKRNKLVEIDDSARLFTLDEAKAFAPYAEIIE